ncbi:GNAT family N-acetyltransferase [Bacillus sp. BGMRC 2118]|nr:GNAT family N-acetyltransferase [Bacillus sp. BGMRC 2118]
MNQLKLVKNNREIEKVRKSFNELAQKTFGINFESWYEKGYWTEKYIPFCYVDQDEVVANVSVNVIDLIVLGEKKRAIQIGTVMTNTAYRNQGLSRKLMEGILNSYEGHYDIMYLFANESVLEFYPKFGFVPIDEYLYYMDFDGQKEKQSLFKKLDGTNQDDLNFIYHYASKRLPVSSTFAAMNTEELLMFYCINVFPHNIYYSELLNVIVIGQHENSELHLFDVISHQKVNIEKIIQELSTLETKKVVFHYTPEYDNITLKKLLHKGSEQLFVKRKSHTMLPSYIKHPLTSQA